MIVTRNLTKIFRRDDGEIHALRDVNLSIERGEFISIIGPSGSGKTTLLLSIAGLITPTRGEVLIDNTSLFSLSQRRRRELRAERCGFVFQLFHLIPYLTAVENVQVAFLAGRKNKVSPPVEQARSVLRRLALGDRLEHKPEELSVGERQRVALARALVNSPEIILADEPTGNIDEQNADAVVGYLKEFNRQGMTIVLVTHDSRIAREASRQLSLREGILRAERHE